VQDADRELLLEQRHQRAGAGGVVGVLALQVLGEQLDEAHLGRQETGGGELRDEAAPGMPAQEQVGLEVARVRDVLRPPGERDLLVGLDS
jgi:hypothetical protein